MDEEIRECSFGEAYKQFEDYVTSEAMKEDCKIFLLLALDAFRMRLKAVLQQIAYVSGGSRDSLPTKNRLLRNGTGGHRNEDYRKH